MNVQALSMAAASLSPARQARRLSAAALMRRLLADWERQEWLRNGDAALLATPQVLKALVSLIAMTRDGVRYEPHPIMTPGGVVEAVLQRMRLTSGREQIKRSLELLHATGIITLDSNGVTLNYPAGWVPPPAPALPDHLAQAYEQLGPEPNTRLGPPRANESPDDYQERLAAARAAKADWRQQRAVLGQRVAALEHQVVILPPAPDMQGEVSDLPRDIASDLYQAEVVTLVQGDIGGKSGPKSLPKSDSHAAVAAVVDSKSTLKPTAATASPRAREVGTISPISDMLPISDMSAISESQPAATPGPMAPQPPDASGENVALPGELERDAHRQLPGASAPTSSPADKSADIPVVSKAKSGSISADRSVGPDGAVVSTSKADPISQHGPDAPDGARSLAGELVRNLDLRPSATVGLVDVVARWMALGADAPLLREVFEKGYAYHRKQKNAQMSGIASANWFDPGVKKALEGRRRSGSLESAARANGPRLMPSHHADDPRVLALKCRDPLDRAELHFATKLFKALDGPDEGLEHAVKLCKAGSPRVYDLIEAAWPELQERMDRYRKAAQNGRGAAPSSPPPRSGAHQSPLAVDARVKTEGSHPHVPSVNGALVSQGACH